jgi:hypothetical protein
MITQYLILALILAVAGLLLPLLTLGRENRTWTVFLLRKPLPYLCLGLAAGFAVSALILFLKK